MAKTIQEKVLQTPTVIRKRIIEEHSHSKLTVKMRTINNPQTFLQSTKTYNLRDRYKAESRTDKRASLSDSEKQQQSNRHLQHGQKDDDDNDIGQSNQLIGNAIHSDTTSMGGGDADNKDGNDKYNPNSYIEFPLRHIECRQKQRRAFPNTNFQHTPAKEVYS